MKVEVVCIIRDDDGEVVREFKVVEFESVEVTGGAITDVEQN
jgi:hypothetical protein